MVCPLHNECEKWVYLHNFSDPRHATAWLLAWAKLGLAGALRRRNQARRHIAKTPDAAAAREALAELPEGSIPLLG